MKHVKFWQAKGGQRTTATLLAAAMMYRDAYPGFPVAVFDQDALPMAGLTPGMLDDAGCANGLMFIEGFDWRVDGGVEFSTDSMEDPDAKPGDYNVLVSTTEYLALARAVHSPHTFPIDAFVTYHRPGLALTNKDAYRALSHYGRRTVHVEMQDDIAVARAIDAGLFLAAGDRMSAYCGALSELVADIHSTIGATV